MKPVEVVYAVIGIRICEARQAAGLTQEDVGDAIGMTRQSVAQMELGVQRIMLHHLEPMARVLRVRVSDLLPASFAAEAPRRRTPAGRRRARSPGC